ncbi:MAG TPA: TIM-barrel domain-containing protein [Williamwhitmania sp.]|nr:TIM-barrel domain-containing protein [Williamwhitmania sp.]
MIRKAQAVLAFGLMSAVCSAQPASRQFIGVKDSLGTMVVNVSDGHYTIVAFNEKMVQTTFYPKGIQEKNFSFAVCMTPQKPELAISQSATSASIQVGKGLKIVITKSPFNIGYYYHDTLLIAENKGYERTDSTQIMSLSIQPKEVLYGGGERALGMNHRGYDLTLYNRAHYGYQEHSELMNYTLPMFLSSKRYAVLFDNASLGWLDLDSHENNTINYTTMSGTINYCVIAGDSWYDLENQYTQLTGRQPLPPRWAFGNFSSRFGYHSQQQVLSTVDKFFKDSIPLDAVIIDIYWFGKGIFGDMGRLDWYRDSFPEPIKMMQTLKAKGVKTILVTEPFILTTSTRWQEAVDNQVLGTDTSGKPYTFDFYFGHTGLIDIFKPKAQQWFWNIYKGLTKQGVDGWWGDLGEPEVHPAGLQHVIGSANEVHNAYGHIWAKVVFDGYKKDFPNTRPFILMRAGYAGSQRYGMIPWSGDVSRSWGGLVPQPEIALQMGMQGLGYAHSDLGGFAGGEKIDNELYIRWLQYGVFQPIFRPHAQEQIPPEPVFQNDTTMAYAKAAVELRYKLLPYVYSLAFDNSQTGKPLMRPLFFNEPNNPQLLTYDKAYMWGDAFLVSPVKAQGIKEQAVYLPKGTSWTDFFTGKVYNGGKDITLPLTLNHIPVLVKGGAIIPMLQKVASTTQANFNQLEVHYYLDPAVATSSYDLYNDDGETPNDYINGNYEKLNIEVSNTSRLLAFMFAPEIGKIYTIAKDKDILLTIHNSPKKPKKVLVNGKKQGEWSWVNGEVAINISVPTTSNTKVTLKY